MADDRGCLPGSSGGRQDGGCSSGRDGGGHGGGGCRVQMQRLIQVYQWSHWSV